MGRQPLRRVALEGIPESRGRARDREAEEVVAPILLAVERGGEAELRAWSERLGELGPGDRLYVDRAALLSARDSIDPRSRALLERCDERVRTFADAQRACLADLELPVPGGRAGHQFLPVARAGCYVPGGRFPLASSAIMTVAPARAAGVDSVWCAGPRPAPETLAAAAISGADGFLAAGGAQAVAALAFGCGPIEARDVIVGPGGRYVAAAKRLLFGVVGTEAPAGPSELLVLAGTGADPELIAADLLAQAEHDPRALPCLVTLDPDLPAAVDAALGRRLAALPAASAENAALALDKGWVFVAASADEAREAARRAAPEHLEVVGEGAEELAVGLTDAGAIFIGEGSAEVMGDYGAGPNHCLPTGGAARFAAGLSVLSFLRARTWLRLDDPSVLAGDAAALARIEGLEAHARAAELRKGR